ncbi:hypothetical protein FSST1_001122 [Fusarium sambucinum]
MERSSQDIELESLGSTCSAQHQPVPERAGSRTDTDTNEATLEDAGPFDRLGHGLIFCPALVVLSTHFATRRAGEIGFALCGSAMLVVVNSVKLATLILALLLVKPKAKPDQFHPIIGVAMLKNIGYILFVVAYFCATIGIYIAYDFLALYSRTTVDIPFSSDESFVLLAIFNSVGIASYFITCTTGHAYGPINVSALGMADRISTSVLLDSHTQFRQHTRLSVFYRIAAATVQSLLYMSIPSFTEEQDRRGVRARMALMIVSLAALTGPPIADTLIKLQGGLYGCTGFCWIGDTVGFCIFSCSQDDVDEQNQSWVARKDPRINRFSCSGGGVGACVSSILEYTMVLAITVKLSDHLKL